MIHSTYTPGFAQHRLHAACAPRDLLRLCLLAHVLESTISCLICNLFRLLAQLQLTLGAERQFQQVSCLKAMHSAGVLQ
jgi:hypothetical protein